LKHQVILPPSEIVSRGYDDLKIAGNHVQLSYLRSNPKETANESLMCCGIFFDSNNLFTGHSELERIFSSDVSVIPSWESRFIF